MSEQAVVSVRGVHKEFVLPHEKSSDSLKRAVTGIFSKSDEGFEIQHALRDVSFEVRKGEFFGIVGRNGSGKSTLLKMLAGIYQPTKGTVAIEGKLVPFIELGVGFNPELTGRENVYLNGALLGFSRKEVDERYEEVVEFAELERFMDQKLKNYSSGMQVRLAFSVAIMAEADVLLVDEVLAVGDASFQRKCFEYFRLLKKNKKTVVFVTHEMSAVREYCDRAMLIEKSRIVDIGSPDVIATEYAKLFNGPTKATKEVEKSKRWGDGSIKITEVVVKPDLLVDNGQNLNISVTMKAYQDVEDPVLGFLVKSQSGQQLLGTNSRIKKQTVGTVKKGETISLEWSTPNIFSDGVYYIDVAAQHRDGGTVCDWWEEAARFDVANEERVHYPINPPIELVVKNSAHHGTHQD